MKKLLSLSLALCVLLTACLAFASCESNDGIYYLYEDGSTNTSSWVKLSGSKWSDSDGMGGTFKLEDDHIYFYVTWEDKEELLLDGTLADGKLTIGGELVTIVYYLEGKAPQEDSTGDAVATGELEFTLNEETDTYFATGIGTFTGSKLVIPSEYNGKAVTGIAGSWGVVSNVKEIIIPDSVTFIGTAHNGVSGMFEYFTDLEHIDFGNGIDYIPDKVCNRVDTLKTVVLGSNVKSIGEDAFNHTGITSITIPEGCKTIGAYAFMQCTALETVNLPASVTWIRIQAFYACDNLTTIYYAGSEQEWFDNMSIEIPAISADVQIVYGK